MENKHKHYVAHRGYTTRTNDNFTFEYLYRTKGRVNLMPTFTYRPVPKNPSHAKVEKPPKVEHKRSGPTQRQLGAISPKVRKEVRERSKGLCEVRKKCKGAPAVQQAHLTGRGTIKHKTTAADLKDACVACHQWLDSHGEGVKHKKSLRKKDAK